MLTRFRPAALGSLLRAATSASQAYRSHSLRLPVQSKRMLSPVGLFGGTTARPLSSLFRKPQDRRSWLVRTLASDHHRQNNPQILSLSWIIIGVCSSVTILYASAKARKDRKTVTRLWQNTLLSWNALSEGRWWTLLTSAFTHVSPGHLLFNMFACNAFCGILATIPGVGLGSVLFLVFQSALTSSVSWLAYDLQRRKAAAPDKLPPSSACGFSGVGMGLAAAAACLAPRTPMSLLFIPIPIPLIYLTAGYVAFDLYSYSAQDGIGHSAHLGGFVYGIVHYLVFYRRLRIPGSLFRGR